MKNDEAYKNGAYIPGADDFVPRWVEAAAAWRKAMGRRAELRLSYGPNDRHWLDFFHPEGPAKGTFVFVHGGYWRAFDASYWSHFARGALAQGWAVAMPSYDLCPDVSIADITQQIAEALAAIAARTDGPIALAGHSAGGHLVARMLDPAVLPDALRARIVSVLPISPLSDLEPLIETQMNADFGLDVASARAESPLDQPRPVACDVTVWVGADEQPAFLDQAAWLAQAWAADHVIAPGRHHFDVIDDLQDPQSAMIAAVLRL